MSFNLETGLMKVNGILYLDRGFVFVYLILCKYGG